MGLLKSNLDRFDADGNAVLDRALGHVLASVLDERFPEIKFRRFLPLETGVPRGARTLIWYNIKHVGMAKIIAAYADDLPRADAQLQENISRIRTLGASF